MILLIEDQVFYWDKIKDALSDSSKEIRTCSTLEEAFQILQNNQIDLLLLDLKLNGKNGMDLLKYVRRQNPLLPVIILSSLSDMETRKLCFEMGADDYIIKPILPGELKIRVNRALERSKHFPDANKQMSKELVVGQLKLDLAEKVLYVNGKKRVLRNKLYDLLLLFMQNPNKVIKKEIFYRSVWKGEVFDENSLNVHIHQLRKLIGNEGSMNPRIVTSPKVGYRLHLNEEQDQ